MASAFISHAKTTTMQVLTVDTVHRARTALSSMTREIRMAGYRTSASAVPGISQATAGSIRILVDLNQDGTISGSDEDISYTFDDGNKTINRNGNVLAEHIESLTLTYTMKDGSTAGGSFRHPEGEADPDRAQFGPRSPDGQLQAVRADVGHNPQKHEPLGDMTMNERGFALVTCILMIAMVLILSAIASQSITSDLKVAGTDRSMKQAFSIAESGTEEARARMSPVSTSPITDGSPASTTWETYIGTPSRCQQLGYDSSNSNHFRYDSVSGLNYTVKINHKVNGSGQVLLWGDTNTDGKYEENTTKGEPIYVITSIGRNSGAARSVRIEAARTPPVTSVSALYTKNNLVIKGSSTYISGNEGTETGPGVVSKGSIAENGNPSILGDPPTLSNSPIDIDVGAMIDANKAKAGYSYNSPGTMTGMNWGTPTAGATSQSPLACGADNVVYISGNAKLAGGTKGCGMLMVDGNLELNGGFQWYGPILVRGSLSYTGGGQKNVTGGILAGGTGSVDDIGGNAVVLHSNSALHQVIGKMPLTVLRWVEVF